MAQKKIRQSKDMLRDWLGKEIKVDFSKNTIMGNSVEGTLKEIYEDNFIELTNCTDGLPKQLINLKEAIKIGLKE